MSEEKIRKMAEAAIEVEKPWYRARIVDHEDKLRVDILIGYARGSLFKCPKCGAENQPVHDTRRRIWEHVRVEDRRCYIKTRVPRIRCGECGKFAQVEIPWAPRSRSGLTQEFEELLVTSCTNKPLRTVADQFGLGKNLLWRVKKYHEAHARSKKDPSG